MSLFRPKAAKLLSILMLVPLIALALSSCGPAGGGKTVTVASKLDVESQLITKMYTLLLRKAGYTVNEKPALGNSTIIFQAIKSKQIDLYPEFTATALSQLKVPSAHDPHKDYQTVKDAYDKQYQITWLDPSPLNDGYALCTSQKQSQSLGLTTLSQVAAKASSLAATSPSDGVPFVDGLQSVYGLTSKSFKSFKTVDYALGFQAVSSNQAQVTVCYTTDGTIQSQGFTFLEDDKHGFPEFNPAPIVRNDVLNQYPDIAQTLNPLAPKLTTQISIQLQQQVATKKAANEPVAQAVTEVATDFLKGQKLL